VRGLGVIGLPSDGTWNPGSTSGEWSPRGCACRLGLGEPCSCAGSCGCPGEGASCDGRATCGSGEVPHLPDYEGDFWVITGTSYERLSCGATIGRGGWNGVVPMGSGPSSAIDLSSAGFQGPGQDPPSLHGEPTPIGEGLTAPFTNEFVPDRQGSSNYGSAPPGRTSITVDDESWLLSHSDCKKIIFVHLCIDAAAAQAACGAQAQKAIDNAVKGIENGIHRWLSSVFCPCDDATETYAPGGCYRRVIPIWHRKCGKATNGITPLTVNVRCSSKPGQPTGLTTPDRQIDVDASRTGPFMDEVYAHEIGHNLLGIPPPGGGDLWDGQGHNVNDPDADIFNPLMGAGLRNGKGRVSRKEACTLVSLTGGCDKELCCKPIIPPAVAVAQYRSAGDRAPRGDQAKALCGEC
jgi:hypothetical protein